MSRFKRKNGIFKFLNICRPIKFAAEYYMVLITRTTR